MCFVCFFVCRAQGEEETFAGVTGVVGKAAGEGEAGRRSSPEGPPHIGGGPLV